MAMIDDILPDDDYMGDPTLVLNANKLLNKTAQNMTIAEARTNEHPLWTEKTAELERRAERDK